MIEAAYHVLQGTLARFIDWFLDRWLPVRSWFASKWHALKSKALAALKKLRTRNTGDR